MQSAATVAAVREAVRRHLASRNAALQVAMTDRILYCAAEAQVPDWQLLLMLPDGIYPTLRQLMQLASLAHCPQDVPVC